MLIKTPNYEKIMTESENILLKKRGLLSIFLLQILVSDLPKMSIIDVLIGEVCLVLTTRGMKTSSTCSVVLVAGHHLLNIQGVLDMVDTMSSSILRIPYAMVLLVEKKETAPDIPHISIPTAVVS